MAKRTTPKSKSPVAPPVKQWNVFVYLAGDNNLSDEMVWSLLGMQAATKDPRFGQRVNLTAVFDPSGLPPLVYRFPAKGQRRPNRFGLEDFGGKPSPLSRLSGLTTFAQLSQFFENHRADPELNRPGGTAKRMIILSGHGDGVRGLLNGNPANGVLSVRQLGDLLRNDMAARHNAEPKTKAKVEILGLEACAMGMLELCYEVRDSVDWLIGTESFVANNGWPYERMLEPLLSQDDPQQVATRMAERYAQYYTEFDVGGVSTDVAVISLRALDRSGLVEAIGNLARALCDLLNEGTNEPPMSADERKKMRVPKVRSPTDELVDALVIARWRAQSYSQDDFVDLQDWVVQFQAALRSRPARDERLDTILKWCAAVLDALDAVVLVSLYQGPAYQHSHGLSIYYPAAESRYSSAYKELAFAQVTNWSDFLAIYLERSRRGLRREGGARQVYAFEPTGAPAQATLVPGSVRTPSNGTKRQTPSNGIRTPEELEGYVKNGPRAWYRDRRFETGRGARRKNGSKA